VTELGFPPSRRTNPGRIAWSTPHAPVPWGDRAEHRSQEEPASLWTRPRYKLDPVPAGTAALPFRGEQHFGFDTVEHFFACAAVSLLAYLSIKRFFPSLAPHRFLIALLGGIAVGVLKEAGDWLQVRACIERR
jgi:hypothetical protein